MKRDREMISVIIPVYNIMKQKKHFKRAVKSVLTQKDVELQLILVNDGSRDESRKVLEKFADKDTRIKVIHKENGGVESARRRGIAESDGEYIFHMDQDDILKKNALNLLLTSIESEQSDIVVANSERTLGIIKNKTIPECMRARRTLTHSEFMKELYISFFGINKMPVNIWGKLYRKSFLENQPEPPLTGQINEDLSYNMHVFPYAKKITLLPDIIYSYRWGVYITCRFNVNFNGYSGI